MDDIADVARARRGADAGSSYVASLFARGRAKIAQKVGEEGLEVALAAVSRPVEEVTEEIADLLYHLTVLMQAQGIGWGEVIGVLEQRHRPADGG